MPASALAPPSPADGPSSTLFAPWHDKPLQGSALGAAAWPRNSRAALPVQSPPLPPLLGAWPSAGVGAAAGPSGVPIATHTMMRVSVPRSSRQHPLSGLWKGMHGRHGAQVGSGRACMGRVSTRGL
eukprot:361952-Chlamydomonas_euryale.AAC.5